MRARKAIKHVSLSQSEGKSLSLYVPRQHRIRISDDVSAVKYSHQKTGSRLFHELVHRIQGFCRGIVQGILDELVRGNPKFFRIK